MIEIKDIEKRLLNRGASPMDPQTYYAVMVPLIEVEDGSGLHVLFEVRAHELQAQPGEVCLPGGKKEEGESPEECAIRETCEELCIKPSCLKVIGQLDYMVSYSGFTLYPYIGLIEDGCFKDGRFNNDEVHETFTVPLDFFLENEPLLYEYNVVPQIPEDFPYHLIGEDKNYSWRTGRSEIPIYKYGDHTIWGLTARIMKGLVRILKSS